MIICVQQKMALFSMRTLDVDAGRRLAPLIMSRYYASAPNNTKSFAAQGMQKMESCSLMGGYGLLHAPVYANTIYNATLGAVPPTSFRLWYFSSNPSDSIVFSIFMPQVTFRYHCTMFFHQFGFCWRPQLCMESIALTCSHKMWRHLLAAPVRTTPS